MMEMLINGVDAQTMGIRMGEGFLDAIGAPLPLKEFIENKFRLENGKKVLYTAPRRDEREVTLTFNIHGNTETEYLANKKAFEEILYAGKVTIFVPVNNESYRLTYLRSQSFAQNIFRTHCTVSVKFNEPDPSDRQNE